jgi:hypothetical protein
VIEQGKLRFGLRCDVAEAEGAETEEECRGGAHARHAGTAAEKLALFEKLKAAGGFAKEDRAELLKVEKMLRTFAAMEKGIG